MIGYTTVGANDLAKAKGFYDAVLAPLGGNRASFGGRMHIYSSDSGASLTLCTPWDGKAATVGNGMMVGLTAPSRAVVDQVYALALANGGTDEGPPGERAAGAYGAYFRDLDGNKIAVIARG